MIDRANLTNVYAGGYATFNGQKTFVTDIQTDSDGKVTSVSKATFDINNGMFIN